jgi:ADP-dependent NAD(P)H-hydrate dehydratase
MPNDARQNLITVTPNFLRGWPLPSAGNSKYERGQVVVIGGAARSPGAAMLAGLAALRVGAGRLTLAVGASVATQIAVAIPECGVVPLPETLQGHVAGEGVRAAASDIAAADAVLVGPGLDEPEEMTQLLRLLPELVSDHAILSLDAYALGVLRTVPELAQIFAGRLILSPNESEATRLLDRDSSGDIDDVREIADRYNAVVTCGDFVCIPDGQVWEVGTGTGGLGTSGSGDVLAGAIAGLAARGADAAQAAVWATHIHASAGDRLAIKVASLGYLASELLPEIPRVIAGILP